MYEELIQLKSKKTKIHFINSGPEWTFFQGRHKKWQQVHEKILIFTHHQGNADTNHNQVSPHTVNSCHQKDNR